MQTNAHTRHLAPNTKGIPPIALTPGEPAGIGPDICLSLAATGLITTPWVAVASLDLLRARTKQLGLNLDFHLYHDNSNIHHGPGQVTVLDIPLQGDKECQAGVLSTHHVPYVMACLQRAATGCLQKHFAALVTGPVHKGIINQAGVGFSGHTEYFAAISATPKVVMMLANPRLRVALLTTHIPLSQVPAQLTQDNLSQTLTILNQGLKKHYGLSKPRIAVCGLNPHAGDHGAIGREEIDIMQPCLAQLRQQGMAVSDPVSADTIFISDLDHRGKSKAYDAILALYHDQGLPAIKTTDFGDTVNITLGLPFIRTSVDHGTALNLAGTGKANFDSLHAAMTEAARLVRQ